jgi:uncharacterized protein (DUF1499 family)
MARSILSVLAALSLTACVSAPGPEGPWISFTDIAPGSTSNRALACNEALCPAAQSMRPSIELEASASAVLAALSRIEPNVEVQNEASGDIRVRYVAVTPLMRFRDDVDVLVHPVSAERSLVAVYSRSRVGLSDLGANSARIEALEQRLKAEIAR